MTNARDRLIAAAAVLAVAGLAALVVAAVLDAQRRGRAALEDNQVAHMEALADSMDRRIQQALAAAPRYSPPVTTWSFEPGDQGDAGQLEPPSPDARSGNLLVDADGTIVNGSLLRDAGVIGTTLDRPGLAEVLETGTPRLLPVVEGTTTSLPTLGIAYPIIADGEVQGAYVAEVEVSADSFFNEEVAELRQGETGVFAYIGQLGTVVASSDPDLLGRNLSDDPFVASGDRDVQRADGFVSVVADIPSGPWRVLFRQDADEFDGGLSGSLRSALLFLAIAVMVGGGVLFVGVLSRLRTARLEQRRLAKVNEAHEDFVGIVSHELRTPVAGLAGFLQTTLDHWEGMDEDGRRNSVTRAYANARRLQSLTADVLDARQLETGELAYTFDLVDLAEQVREAVDGAESLQPGRTIELRGADRPVWVRADAVRLQQVLSNLLDNAGKHTPPDTAVEVNLETDGGEAVVQVCDRGPGLSSDDLERVFDKFVRGRGTVSRGSGLGLFICRQIIDAHQGRIWAAANDDGHGAVLSFAIPAVEAPVDPGQPVHRST